MTADAPAADRAAGHVAQVNLELLHALDSRGDAAKRGLLPVLVIDETALESVLVAGTPDQVRISSAAALAMTVPELVNLLLFHVYHAPAEHESLRELRELYQAAAETGAASSTRRVALQSPAAAPGFDSLPR
jgi:hypothetical protein